MHRLTMDELVLPYFEHQTGNVSRLQQRSVIFNHSLTLLCPAIGSPKPNLVWYFNGKEIQPEKKHLIIKQHGKKLVIHRIRVSDSRIPLNEELFIVRPVAG